ncbi:MAG: hypothetical protein F6J97_22445 [Leptolyngbya sp. SIO4C1]|nr:hypothetical protein [Leptolyngbya sp. SIO4C1]
MDTEKQYRIGEHRLVLGWCDTEQSYYARIETDQEKPEILWTLADPRDRLNQLLQFISINLRTVTGLENFQLSTEDQTALQEAPDCIRIDPAQLQRLDILDTDYVQVPAWVTDPYFEQPDIVEEVDTLCQDRLAACVARLVELQHIEHSGEPLDDYGSVDDSRNRAIAETAVFLAETGRLLSDERLQVLSSTPFDNLWHISELFMEAEIEDIDGFTCDLCRSRLSDFPKAIQRGYDPTTGLPLSYAEADGFSWANTVPPPSAASLYQQYGFSEEAAWQLVHIQRTDPRDRTEQDWAFLSDALQRLSDYTEQLSEAWGLEA